eukprot:4728721-Amphidinium_carterae.1
MSLLTAIVTWSSDIERERRVPLEDWQWIDDFQMAVSKVGLTIAPKEVQIALKSRPPLLPIAKFLP